MALGLYSAANENSLIDGDNQFTVTFDGRIGGSQDKLVYLRNDARTRWYSEIKLTVVDTEDAGANDITDGSKPGWSWKLAEKDIPLTFEEWELVNESNELVLSSSIGSNTLADIATYFPIWIRIEIPRGQRIQTITDVVIRIDGRENLVNA